jgi:hypothetical protein
MVPKIANSTLQPRLPSYLALGHERVTEQLLDISTLLPDDHSTLLAAISRSMQFAAVDKCTSSSMYAFSGKTKQLTQMRVLHAPAGMRVGLEPAGSRTVPSFNTYYVQNDSAEGKILVIAASQLSMSANFTTLDIGTPAAAAAAVFRCCPVQL